MSFLLRLASAFLVVVALNSDPNLAFAAPASGVSRVELHALQLLTPDKVRAQVSVRDDRGKAVYNLTARDFSIRREILGEKSRSLAVSEVKAVAGDDDALAVVLCVDSSGSMKKWMSPARQTALRVLDVLRERDQVALIEFNVAPRVLLHFTTEKTVARAVVKRLQAKSGNTALLDALDSGRALFSPVRTPRRALILISDGGDNASALRAQEVALLATHSDLPPIFAWSVRDDAVSGNASQTALQSLCAQSGGRWFSSRAASTLPALRAALEHLRRDSYQLTFAAPPRGTGENVIAVGAISSSQNSTSSTQSGENAVGGSGNVVFSATRRLQAAPPLPPDTRPLWSRARLLALLLGCAALCVFVGLARRKTFPHEAYLRDCSGEQRRYALKAQGAVLGRGREADIQIDDEEISRRHSRFSLVDNAWMISDLGSTNGVLLNGQRVQSARLKEGDRIQIGNTVLEFQNAVAS